MSHSGIANNHVTDSLAAYALNALEEAEARQVGAHLDVCPECYAEFLSYQPVVDQLALGTPVVQPPSTLKNRLMERIRSPRQAAPSASALPGWKKLAEALRGGQLRWQMASLVVIVALLASNVLLWLRVQELGHEPEPGLYTVTLLSTEVAPGASGLIVISADGRWGTLVVDRLPALDDAQVYQLWLIEDGQRTSGGTFAVNRLGYGVLEIDVQDRLLIEYPSFGITIEPAGGSPSPTGDKVLGGDL